jgi:hypothetical protein
MEENKGKDVILRKLHLHSLINILTDLYECGVDYVDFCGKNDEEQDIVDIRFSKDYTIFKDITEEEAMESIKENFNRIMEEENNDDVPPPPPPTTKYKLSDDDLNQLI